MRRRLETEQQNKEEHISADENLCPAKSDFRFAVESAVETVVSYLLVTFSHSLWPISELMNERNSTE